MREMSQSPMRNAGGEHRQYQEMNNMRSKVHADEPMTFAQFSHQG